MSSWPHPPLDSDQESSVLQEPTDFEGEVGNSRDSSRKSAACERRNVEDHAHPLPYAQIASADDRRPLTGLLGGNSGSMSENIRPGSWSRAGLLQPRSVASGSSSQSSHNSRSRPSVFSRTPDDIRASTVQLSNMAMLAPPQASRLPYTPQPYGTSSHSQQRANVSPYYPHQLRTPLSAADLERVRGSLMPGFGFPRISPTSPPHMRVVPESLNKRAVLESNSVSPSSFPEVRSVNPPSLPAEHADAEAGSSSSSSSPSTPKPRSPETPVHPSGLSLLLVQQRQRQEMPIHQPGSPSAQKGTDSQQPKGPRVSTVSTTAHLPPTLTHSKKHSPANDDARQIHSSAPASPLSEYIDRLPADESSPLLGFDSSRRQNKPLWDNVLNHTKLQLTSASKRFRAQTSKRALATLCNAGLRSIPAVLLGMLLNILDGVSYGMILFPSNDAFPNFGGIGVSMFFVTTIISQLVYSFGGSGFAGANGSMMIEVVPFFHILAADITRELGEENTAQIVSTTIAAFALSSILTGITFFLLGYLRLGVIIGFFPRHILVGCIGGVGVFLIQTGLAVCARIDDDDFTYTLETLKFLVLNTRILTLWAPAFALAVILRLITSKFHHQLIFPVYFMIIPVIFYAVVAAAGLDLTMLRREGWIFDMGGSSESWFKFYSYFNWQSTSLRVLWVTMPTQFALLFFNILHPPLNVPALAVSLNEDVDTNKELVAHGYSNILAGLFGTVPNYLVYVNTLLFYRVGGTTRLSGFLLAIATFFLLVIGTAPIGYIPILLVGALIFVLGIDLVKEAVWDTRHRVSWTEYLTIISIMICMTLWDFVIGVLFGIVICCFFFVVQNSQRRSIRAMFTGETAMSAVRRPSAHRDYIRQVAKQTVILRLQGFLFFGTIAQVEDAIRTLLEPSHWQRNPVRFLVIDLSLVAGIDMSSAEAFVRIQRLLSARCITIVLCGFSTESSIGKSLHNVGLFDEDYVETFSDFGDAMEWTENAYLRAWFLSQKNEFSPPRRPIVLPGRHQNPAFGMTESFPNSPRRTHIFAAAGKTIANDISDQIDYSTDSDEAFITLSNAFSSYGQLSLELYRPLLENLERVTRPEGTVLWNQGDKPDGLYFVESGVLQAIYNFPDRKDKFVESMVGGTLTGELSGLSGLPRNSTVVVQKDVVLWKLSADKMARLEEDHPELARMFSHLVLKVAKTDYDILLSALAARQ